VLAFLGQEDEEVPKTASLFEQKYFELCPPHLKSVGGLRAFIEGLLDTKKPWAEDGVPRALTLMYLIIHFHSPALEASRAQCNEDHPNSALEEEEVTRSKIATTATETLQFCLDNQTLAAIPGYMPMLFLLELLPHLSTHSPDQLGLDEAAFEHLFLRREPKELAEGAGAFLP